MKIVGQELVSEVGTGGSLNLNAMVATRHGIDPDHIFLVDSRKGEDDSSDSLVDEFMKAGWTLEASRRDDDVEGKNANWYFIRGQEHDILHRLFAHIYDYCNDIDVKVAGDDYSVVKQAATELREIINRVIPKNKKSFNKFGIVCSNQQGLYVKNFPVNKSKAPDEIEKFYNDSTLEFDKIVRKKLETGKNGIILLHGSPGTGKTTYLRHLIATLGRDVIYMPPDLSTMIGSPAFISFMIEKVKGKLLLIEDAENILLAREGGGNQAVANILNVADGIMGDALQVQMVCTFNTKITEVDAALRRPGRLIGEHKFEALNIEKAKELVGEMYGESRRSLVTGKMTLAEIFNLDQNIPRIKETKAPFGFSLGEPEALGPPIYQSLEEALADESIYYSPRGE